MFYLIKNKNSGFSLIELLVVIAIIAVLAGISSIGLRNSFESTRDTQRKSDLKQYATALEGFANSHQGIYPGRNVGTGVQASTVTCGDLTLTGCPEDPKYIRDNSYEFYKYQSNGTTGVINASRYVLWARLENVTGSRYWVVCSNGKSDETGSFTTSAGACPLP